MTGLVEESTTNPRERRSKKHSSLRFCFRAVGGSGFQAMAQCFDTEQNYFLKMLKFRFQDWSLEVLRVMGDVVLRERNRIFQKQS